MRKITRWIDCKLSEMKISTLLFIQSIFLIIIAVTMVLYVAENLISNTMSETGLFVCVLAAACVVVGITGFQGYDSQRIFESEFEMLIKKVMQHGKS